MVETEHFCIGLWKSGYTLAEAEPKIRRSAARKRYFPKVCEAAFVAARRKRD
jgi:hypothetical protein